MSGDGAGIGMPPATPDGEHKGTDAAPLAVKKRSSAVKVLVCAFALMLIASGGIWFYNYSALQKPLHRVLAADPRNGVVNASAHFNNWISTDTVVFDLASVSDSSSQLDVFRVLLQYANEMKEHRYERVILAAYGEKKFIVPGDYFQKLGQEYAGQNPMYTVRTFAPHLTDMEGRHPFSEYEGGILAVVGKEMEEFSDMSRQWYLNEYAARKK